jgi:hypothetical protein
MIDERESYRFGASRLHGAGEDHAWFDHQSRAGRLRPAPIEHGTE